MIFLERPWIKNSDGVGHSINRNHSLFKKGYLQDLLEASVVSLSKKDAAKRGFSQGAIIKFRNGGREAVAAIALVGHGRKKELAVTCFAVNGREVDLAGLPTRSKAEREFGLVASGRETIGNKVYAKLSAVEKPHPFDILGHGLSRLAIALKSHPNQLQVQEIRIKLETWVEQNAVPNPR